MNAWFTYNCLHLALVALCRRNFGAAESYLQQARRSDDD